MDGAKTKPGAESPPAPAEPVSRLRLVAPSAGAACVSRRSLSFEKARWPVAKLAAVAPATYANVQAGYRRAKTTRAPRYSMSRPVVLATGNWREIASPAGRPGGPPATATTA